MSGTGKENARMQEAAHKAAEGDEAAKEVLSRGEKRPQNLPPGKASTTKTPEASE